MYTSFLLAIGIPQREKVRKIVCGGEVSAWIADAVCNLIEKDKKKPLRFYQFKHERKNEPLRYVKCFLKTEEIERLKSIVSRIKHEGHIFSKTYFVVEAVRRKLHAKVQKRLPLAAQSKYINLRVRPEVRSWIKKYCFERKKRMSYFLTECLIKAVQEFLDEKLIIFVETPHEKTKDTVSTTFKVPSEFSKKIKAIVAKAKKIYPAFSVSSFLAEVARRKFENEMGS